MEHLPKAEAAFRSKCPNCGEEIEEGDPIFRCEAGWVCESCSDEWSP